MVTKLHDGFFYAFQSLPHTSRMKYAVWNCYIKGSVSSTPKVGHEIHSLISISKATTLT